MFENICLTPQWYSHSLLLEDNFPEITLDSEQYICKCNYYLRCCASYNRWTSRNGRHARGRYHLSLRYAWNGQAAIGPLAEILKITRSAKELISFYILGTCIVYVMWISGEGGIWGLTARSKMGCYGLQIASITWIQIT